jgi:hypothetical protein
MYLTSLHIQGLRGAEDFSATGLEQVASLPKGPFGVAAADGLDLLAGALNGKRLPGLLADLGLIREPADASILEEDGFPRQVTFREPHGVAALLPVDGSRQVTASAVFQLDPPLFGRLRQHAVRDPRLVSALSEAPRATLKVGWLFTNDLVTASVAPLGIAVGETPFPLTGSDRPPWLSGFLRDVGLRFGRVSWKDDPATVARRLLAAALSPDPERRAKFRRVAEVLEKPPFLLGHLELVQVGDQVEACFGPSLHRARQFGPAAAEALRLVEAVVLEGPDVLVVEAPGVAQVSPEQVRGWLAEHASGERATLEQVLLVPGGPVELDGTA